MLQFWPKKNRWLPLFSRKSERDSNFFHSGCCCCCTLCFISRYMRIKIVYFRLYSMKLHLWYVHLWNKTKHTHKTHREKTKCDLKTFFFHTKILAFDLSTTKQNYFCVLSRICVWNSLFHTRIILCAALLNQRLCSTATPHSHLQIVELKAASGGKSENSYMPYMIHYNCQDMLWNDFYESMHINPLQWVKSELINNI